MLVRPHSKQVLQAAIKSDAEYLSKSNIMDYSSVLSSLFPRTSMTYLTHSLLVGVDEERKQIACGLVDTIGPLPHPRRPNKLLIVLSRKLYFCENP
jgi:1-phosphatidylinositol-3-phosphate 5-kinase